MTRMDRAYKRSSPFQSCAQRLCNSHIAGWVLTKEEWSKLENGKRSWQVRSAQRITRSQDDHRDYIDQCHRGRHQTKSAPKHLHAVLLTLEDHWWGSQMLIGGRAADAECWLAARLATTWLHKMAVDFDNPLATCHQNNSTQLQFDDSDSIDDGRWDSSGVHANNDMLTKYEFTMEITGPAMWSWHCHCETEKAPWCLQTQKRRSHGTYMHLQQLISDGHYSKSKFTSQNKLGHRYYDIHSNRQPMRWNSKDSRLNWLWKSVTAWIHKQAGISELS